MGSCQDEADTCRRSGSGRSGWCSIMSQTMTRIGGDPLDLGAGWVFVGDTPQVGAAGGALYGPPPGLATKERERLKELERENLELCRAVWRRIRRARGVVVTGPSRSSLSISLSLCHAWGGNSSGLPTRLGRGWAARG